MPIVQLKHCAVEGDLAQALLDLRQYIGETSDFLTQSINEIEIPADELASAAAKINQILQQAPVPASPTQVAQEVGLPLPFSTSTDDEIRLEAYGLVLVKGIVWKKGNSSNISNYRKLYFSLGEDLNRLFATLEMSKGFTVIQRKIKTYRLPTKPTWTLAEARTALKNNAIEKIYKRGTDYYAVSLTFLAQDISKEKALSLHGLLPEQVITEVYWIGDVRNDSATLTKLKNLGITDTFLSSVLVGRSFSDIRVDVVQSSLLRVNQLRASITAQVNFLIDRLNVFSKPEKDSLKNEILKTIAEAKKEVSILQQYVRFNSIVVPNRNDLDTFLSKNTREDLTYLFNERRSVLSIDFSATSTDVVQRIRQILAVPVGSTTTSTLVLNNQYIELSTLVDNANFESTKFECAEQRISSATYNFVSLQVALSCLSDDFTSTTVASPVKGYPSYDSPATLLNRNINWVITLGTDQALNNLELIAQSAAILLRPIISAIADATRSARRAIDKFFDDLNKKVGNQIREIETFMSTYMSFFGTASVDSSLLKCALGFNFNPSLPFLNDILPILEALRKKAKNFLAKILAIVDAAITQLVSFPARMINQLLSLAEDYLPPFCKLNRVGLPKDVEANLNEIHQASQVETESSQAFYSSIAKLNGSIEAMPTKFDNFKQNISTNPEPGSRFLKEFKKQVNITAPGGLGGLANSLGI